MIATLEDLARSFATELKALGLPALSVKDWLDHLVARQQAEVHGLNRQLSRAAGNPHQEQKPFRDEKGRMYGYTKMEVPEKLWYHLTTSRAHGGLGMTSREAEEYIWKKFPQCRTRTILPARSCGFSFTRSARKPAAVFGRGTMTFAS